jgi:hypothetical protein
MIEVFMVLTLEQLVKLKNWKDCETAKTGLL